MCYEARQYDQLNEQIVQLTKKRGQLKQVLVCLCVLESSCMSISVTTGLLCTTEQKPEITYSERPNFAQYHVMPG